MLLSTWVRGKLGLVGRTRAWLRVMVFLKGPSLIKYSMENKIQKGPSLIFEFPAKIFLLPVSGVELSYYIYWSDPTLWGHVLDRCN